MRRVSGACCECQRLSRIAYSKAHSEKVRDWKAADQKKHRAKANERSLRWYRANREQAKAATAKWQSEHPERVAAKFAQYRAAKLQATPGWADQDAIDVMYRAAKVLRVSGFDVHVDHIIPLQGRTVHGLHVHNNLQIIQAHMNRSKSNHLLV